MLLQGQAITEIAINNNIILYHSEKELKSCLCRFSKFHLSKLKVQLA